MTATPRNIMALAEMIDHESYVLKMYSRERASDVAKKLRRIADVLDGV